MRRLLIALPNDTLGGAEQYLKMVCTHFASEGDQVHILFLKRKESSSWEDLEGLQNVIQYFTKASSEKQGLVAFLINIWKIRKYTYDYVFTSHVHLTGLLGVLCRLRILEKKYFVGRESTLIFDRFKGIKLLLFKLNYFLGYPALDLLICQTEIMLRQFRDNLPVLSKKIRSNVIPNPISWEQLYGNDCLPISFGGENRLIVAAGRLIPEKGFDILIHAVKNILDVLPDCKLLIFGEGYERDRLMRLISQLNVEERVILMGYEKNVIPFFQAADLCVVSSIIEGFPNVLLQMMAKNVNIVSTLCAGGINDIKGLYIAKPGNIRDLENSLKRCLDSDNTSNRRIFDNYLADRRIDKFILKVDQNLSLSIQD